MAVILVVTLTTQPLIFIKVRAGGRTQAMSGSPTCLKNLILNPTYPLFLVQGDDKVIKDKAIGVALPDAQPHLVTDPI